MSFTCCSVSSPYMMMGRSLASPTHHHYQAGAGDRMQSQGDRRILWLVHSRQILTIYIYPCHIKYNIKKTLLKEIYCEID